MKSGRRQAVRRRLQMSRLSLMVCSVSQRVRRLARAYYDGRSLLGLDLHNYPIFNYLRDIHIRAPIVWIGVAWIGSGLFLAPAIAGGREARGQGLLVDLLFWATVIIVAGALISNWLGVMGYINRGWF